MSDVEVCPGCAARVPRGQGPTHSYLLAVPASWRMYGEVLARRLGDAVIPPDRYPVDAYAVQRSSTRASPARSRPSRCPRTWCLWG